MSVLTRVGILTEFEGNHGRRGYRLKASSIVWTAADGSTAAPDPIRKTVDADTGGRVNDFFRRLYQELSGELRAISAREHTAQVDQHNGRSGSMRSAMVRCRCCTAPHHGVGRRHCEPERGRFAQRAAHPANYAQRSGRAGRSGQPALVLTYCATGNAHDQYYFRRSQEMVAGSVAAPRLDLTNEALLRSHVQAVWLAETGESLESSMIQLLDAAGEKPTLKMRTDKERAFADPDAIRRATAYAQTIVEPMLDELRATAWWHEDWVADVVARCPSRLDEACDRWRRLYRAALADQDAQNRIVLESSQSPKARRAAQARRREAENQLRLLRNEDDRTGHSDFYTYRYFASEGFLPGYSFPRLPLAAYIPAVRGWVGDRTAATCCNGPASWRSASSVPAR